MEVKWLLQSLRDYLRKIDGQLEVDQTCILPLQRIHDEYIMTAIINSQRFTAHTICLLNYCREFLQLLTLADLTTPDGLHLDQAMLYGHVNELSNRTNLHHFKQGKPQKLVWNLWYKANCIWSNGVTLKQPLGPPGLVTNASQRQQSKAYYNHPNRSLYLRTASNSFHQYPLSGNLIQTSTSLHPVDQFPLTALPTLIEAQYHWIPNAEIPTLYLAPSGPTPGVHLENSLLLLFPYGNHLCSILPFSSSTTHLHLQFMIAKPFSCTSDGSVQFLRERSFSWALSLNDGHKLAHCSGPVYGLKPTSYRAEGYG
jgi:hypothetical protein